MRVHLQKCNFLTYKLTDWRLTRSVRAKKKLQTPRHRPKSGRSAPFPHLPHCFWGTPERKGEGFHCRVAGSRRGCRRLSRDGPGHRFLKPSARREKPSPRPRHLRLLRLERRHRGSLAQHRLQTQLPTRSPGSRTSPALHRPRQAVPERRAACRERGEDGRGNRSGSWGRSLSDQARVNGEVHRLGARMHMQLLVDALDVHVDRLAGDAELGADLRGDVA